jgi:hypothetical protein
MNAQNWLEVSRSLDKVAEYLDQTQEMIYSLLKKLSVDDPDRESLSMLLGEIDSSKYSSMASIIRPKVDDQLKEKLKIGSP